jgi:hypothetical protein
MKINTNFKYITICFDILNINELKILYDYLNSLDLLEMNFEIILNKFENSYNYGYHYVAFDTDVKDLYLPPKNHVDDSIKNNLFDNEFNKYVFYPIIFNITQLDEVKNLLTYNIRNVNYKPKQLIRESINNSVIDYFKEHDYIIIKIDVKTIELAKKEIIELINSLNKFMIITDTSLQTMLFTIRQEYFDYDYAVFYIKIWLSNNEFKYEWSICDIVSLEDEYLFTINDLRSGIIENILNIGRNTPKITYEPRKLIREKKTDYYFIIFKVENDEENEKIQKYLFSCNYNWYDKNFGILKPLNSYPFYIFVNIFNNRLSFLDDTEEVNNYLKNDNRMYKTLFDFSTISNFKHLIENIFLINAPNYLPKKLIKENKKILRFNDLENIEYRKGSSKYGNLVIKLMEFLRMFKNKENNEIIFNIDDFEKQSYIKISEIEELINDEKSKNLIRFEIKIENDKIIFSDLVTDKNRFFESFDKDIRKNYELLGVDDFYKQIGNDYNNPHLPDIKECIIKIKEEYKDISLNNVLDLSSGLGEVSNILMELGFINIIGCDPYLYNEYKNKFNKECLNFDFVDIQQGKLNKYKFDTVICSYAMHLADKTILAEMLWNLSLISKNLIILSPNNNPIIKKEYGWNFLDAFKNGNCKCKIYLSENKFEN